MKTSNENNTEATAPGQRVHYCRCLGRWYGRAEWNRLRQMDDRVAIETPDGYKYDYADACLNPKTAVRWEASTGPDRIVIYLCHGDMRWGYGLEVWVGDIFIGKACNYPTGADSYATSDDAFVAAATAIHAVLGPSLDAPAFGCLMPNIPSTHAEAEREQALTTLQEIFGRADEIIARRQQE